MIHLALLAQTNSGSITSRADKTWQRTIPPRQAQTERGDHGNHPVKEQEQSNETTRGWQKRGKNH